MRCSRAGSWVALLLAVAPLLGGCGTAPRAGAGTRQNQRVLTAEEIHGAGYTDLYSVVQALRPQWLWTRGTTTITQTESIWVYMDGNRLGEPGQLRAIGVQGILRIEYVDGLEATNRWGLDHGLGAIVVTTRR